MEKGLLPVNKSSVARQQGTLLVDTEALLGYDRVLQSLPAPSQNFSRTNTLETQWGGIRRGEAKRGSKRKRRKWGTDDGFTKERESAVGDGIAFLKRLVFDEARDHVLHGTSWRKHGCRGDESTR